VAFTQQQLAEEFAAERSTIGGKPHGAAKMVKEVNAQFALEFLYLLR
jgi:hypothetical protein